jgi:hypothetical protein
MRWGDGTFPATPIKQLVSSRAFMAISGGSQAETMFGETGFLRTLFWFSWRDSQGVEFFNTISASRSSVPETSLRFA